MLDVWYFPGVSSMEELKRKRVEIALQGAVWTLFGVEEVWGHKFLLSISPKDIKATLLPMVPYIFCGFLKNGADNAMFTS